MSDLSHKKSVSERRETWNRAVNFRDNPGVSRFWTVSPGLQIYVCNLQILRHIFWVSRFLQIYVRNLLWIWPWCNPSVRRFAGEVMFSIFEDMLGWQPWWDAIYTCMTNLVSSLLAFEYVQWVKFPNDQIFFWCQLQQVLARQHFSTPNYRHMTFGVVCLSQVTTEVNNLWCHFVHSAIVLAWGVEDGRWDDWWVEIWTE